MLLASGLRVEALHVLLDRHVCAWLSATKFNPDISVMFASLISQTEKYWSLIYCERKTLYHD
jgi:hypothetical protein